MAEIPPASGKRFHFFRVIDTGGPPWLLHDYRHHELWTFGHGPPESPTLERLRTERPSDFEILAGLELMPGRLLLATAEGLGVLSVADDRLEPWSRPAPAGGVNALARDGGGRIWLGGSGLWLLDETDTLHELSRLPVVSAALISDIVADPDDPNGVVVSLGDRGLIFVGTDPN